MKHLTLLFMCLALSACSREDAPPAAQVAVQPVVETPVAAESVEQTVDLSPINPSISDEGFPYTERSISLIKTGPTTGERSTQNSRTRHESADAGYQNI
jgi:PBP1b-binding outer membrane lipoprotein LpoB